MNRRLFLSLLGSSWLLGISPALIHAKNVDRKSKNNARREIILYVSSGGNDRWNGAKADKNGSDGPFATITRARDEIRKLKQQQGGSLKQPVKVLLRGGTYFVSETIRFTESDSGSQNTPIVYQAYRNEVPVFSGGKVLSQWQEITVNGRVAWSTTIPAIQQGKWLFHQLWVNGNRARRCRYPKQGYLKVAKALDRTPDSMKGQTRFQYAQGDLKAWQDLSQGEIIIMSQWLESRLQIKDIDPTHQILTLQEPTPLRIDNGNSDAAEAGIYYVENILELLTAAGEWYLNDKTGQVLYLPLKGEQISKSQVIAPVLARLFEFTGDEKSGRSIEHLYFQGLTYSHGEWYYPKQDRSNPPRRRVDLSGIQASANVPSYIYAQGMKSCSWHKCKFSHIGNYVLEFAGSCSGNQVTDCEFYDLGAGGIKIGSLATPSHGKNLISRCHIHDAGILFHSAVGILIGKSSGNIIQNNQIHDLYYTAISVGWTWGYGQESNNQTPDARHNIIQNNHIHHLGKKSHSNSALLNDKGGIYTLGVQPGTIVRGNLVHDIDAYNFGAFGIYLDEGSSNILVENNIVHDIRGYSFHLHYGKSNIIRNNIFAFATIAQIKYSKSEKANKGFIFQNNIVYWRDGNLLSGSWQDLNFAFDRNIYWNQRRQLKFDRLSWQEWREKSMDLNSKVIDPLFIAPDRRDFRLQPNSPALKLGFKLIDN